MAIRTVVTRGYGNGVFDGTIGLVVTRGYLPGVVPAAPTPIVFDKKLRLRTQSLSSLLQRLSMAVDLGQRVTSVSELEQRIQPIYRVGKRIQFVARLRKGGD